MLYEDSFMFLHDSIHIISNEIYTQWFEAKRSTTSHLHELHKIYFMDFYMYAHCEEDFERHDIVLQLHHLFIADQLGLEGQVTSGSLLVVF